MDSQIIFVMLASVGVIALILYSSHADKRKKNGKEGIGIKMMMLQPLKTFKTNPFRTYLLAYILEKDF